MRPIWILLALHLYIGVRIAPQLPQPAGAALFVAALVASAALIPMAFFGRRSRRREVADRWSWAGMLALGLFSQLLVLTLLREVVLLAAALLPLPAIASASAAAVPLLALALTLRGLFNARRTPKVRDVQVPVHGLPQALHGFTIAQVSDLHVGPTIKRPFVQAVVERVNGMQADVVAITGDLVDGRVEDLTDDTAPLAELKAVHGTYFVTGNHEYYSGAGPWIRWLREAGIEVLLDAHVVLQHHQARVVLAGVADRSARHFDSRHRSDPSAALAGAPADADLKVLLAHQPSSASEAADAGFDVQLSGHTHGGQIWPGALLVPLQQPFVAGLHRLRSMWVYVSRGTGYWGPPIRLGAPSEITRLRFVAA